jgi:hypothetical protein
MMYARSLSRRAGLLAGALILSLGAFAGGGHALSGEDPTPAAEATAPAADPAPTRAPRLDAYGYAQLPPELDRRVRQLTARPWRVGEAPQPAADPLAPPALAATPLMDVDYEKMRVLYFARALAIGIQASYFGSGFRERDGTTTTNYGSASSQLAVALCLSWWLANNWYLNGTLGYDVSRSVTRFGEEDRTINRVALATVAFGMGYFRPCFGPFGLLAELNVGFGFGGSSNITRIAGLDPITNTDALWQLQAVGSFGVFYAVHRYLLFAQMGALTYRFRSQAYDTEFGSGRRISSDLGFGLDMKTLSVGMRFLLNYGGQQERYGAR